MPQMHLGNQTLTNFPCLMVSPDNYARAKIPIDGIIGLDVLDDHAFLLDTMKKQITLWGSGTFTQADLKGVDMADAEAVPLTPDGMPAIYSVSGKMTSGKASLTEDLALDTSQPGNFISRDSVALLGLSAVGPPLVIPLQGTIYTIDHTIIPKVSLASLALTDVHTAYADGPVPPGIIQHLGIAFFSQNRVLFDFAHKMMYVKPNLPGTPAATTASAPASAPVTGSH